MTAHILCWRDKASHEAWFIPTDPEARKWRGPFPNPDAMRRKAIADLGTEDVAETWTAIPPHQGLCMTKRDFELIARVVRTSTLRYERMGLARAFADALAATNPRFDRARFIRACADEGAIDGETQN